MEDLGQQTQDAGQGHWTEGRESFSPEMKQAFSKYKTEDDAYKGAYEAIKMTGKPYKLPESIDKLDEKTRGEFTANARKVLGIEGIQSVDELADVNLADGLPEGHPINEEFANAFKQFAAEKKLPKSVIKDLVGFNNKALAGALQQQQAKQLEAMKQTDEALIKHFGSKEKVIEQSELVKRWFKNHSGLTAEEYESVGDELAKSVFTRNPILSRVFMEHFAPLAAEGSTDTGKGGGKPAVQSMEQSTIEQNPKTAKALGWS